MKQVQFSTTVNKKHNVIAEAGEYYILESKPSNWSDACQVAVLKAAVKVVEEHTYHIGQQFYSGIEKYILAQVSPNFVSLISLQNGNRLRESIKVGYVNKITQDELNLMGYSNIILIE